MLTARKRTSIQQQKNAAAGELNVSFIAVCLSMSRDEAQDLVFSARLLVRGWQARAGSSHAQKELEVAIDRLDAVERAFPDLQSEVELVRGMFSRLTRHV